MFLKRHTSCMSPFSSNHHGPNYVLFSFKDWTLELGPSRETFRISPLHQRESVLFTTWHCWALNGDKWRGRHLLHHNFVSLWSSEFFLKCSSVFFSSTDFFLIRCFFFVGDVNKYGQLIAVVYRINSRDFRIQVFQDYWTFRKLLQ